MIDNAAPACIGKPIGPAGSTASAAGIECAIGVMIGERISSCSSPEFMTAFLISTPLFLMALTKSRAKISS